MSGCVGSILLRYVFSRGHLPVRSCARVRRVGLGRPSSEVLMVGGMVLSTLFMFLFCRCVVTMSV